MREMRLVETAIAYPLACACGSQQGPLVDTQITNHQGRLYLCTRCVHTAASLHGYASPEEVSALHEQIDVFRGQTAELEEELQQARDQRVISVGELRRELAATPQ